MRSSVDAEDVMAGCFILGGVGLIFLFFWVYLTVAAGIVLSSFWAWFIAPVFVGLPAVLGVKQAIGISMFVGALNSSYLKAIVEMNKKNEQEESGMKSAFLIVMLLIAPWITLLIGSLFHSWFLT